MMVRDSLTLKWMFKLFLRGQYYVLTLLQLGKFGRNNLPVAMSQLHHSSSLFPETIRGWMPLPTSSLSNAFTRFSFRVVLSRLAMSLASMANTRQHATPLYCRDPWSHGPCMTAFRPLILQFSRYNAVNHSITYGDSLHRSLLKIDREIILKPRCFEVVSSLWAMLFADDRRDRLRQH